MRESAELKAVKRRIRAIAKQHADDPTKHEWAPIEIYLSSDDHRYEMRLGCRCGTFVWIPGREAKRFE